MPFDAGHALVIGVGSYRHVARLDAPVTVSEAQGVAEVLRDPRFCGYPDGQVTFLHDAQADRAGILAAFDRLAATVTPDDTFVLFYAGHGMRGVDGYYLTTHDTQVDRLRRVLAGAGLRDQELLGLIRRIPARRALLVFNACHAGELSPGTLGAAQDELTGEPLPDTVAAALLGAGEGRVVITACRAEQLSHYFRDESTTIFGQALIDGLQGRGISARRGYISVFDLYDYVFSTVSGDVQRRLGKAQEPELTINKGVGVMAVALYRGAQPQGNLGDADRPARLHGQVREVAPEQVQRAVQQVQQGLFNIAAGRDVSGNIFVGGNQFNMPGAQGAVINPQGPVTQRFVNTGGGDYAEGNIDKREGIFGGNVSGQPTGEQRAPARLDDLLAELQALIANAEQGDDDELLTALQRLHATLSGATRARDRGNLARQHEFVAQAQREARELARQWPSVQPLAQQLARLAP